MRDRIINALGIGRFVRRWRKPSTDNCATADAAGSIGGGRFIRQWHKDSSATADESAASTTEALKSPLKFFSGVPYKQGLKAWKNYLQTRRIK